MKKINLRLLKASLVALAATVLVAGHASAATSPGITTYTTGDLIFGAVDSNGTVTNDLEVDIGSINTFIADDNNDPAGTVINVANLNTDLTSAFGSDYGGGGSTAVVWGIVGTSGNNSAGNPTPYQLNSIFLSNPESVPGTMGSGSEFDGSAADISYISQITSMTGSTGNAVTASVFTGEGRTGSGLDATIVADGGSNSYGSREGAAGFDTGFSTNDPDLNDFTGDLSNSGESGLTNSVSDLDVILPVKNTVASDIGAFEFSDTGELEFVTAGAIPEPSTYALLAFGAAVVVWQLRRRSTFNS